MPRIRATLWLECDQPKFGPEEAESVVDAMVYASQHKLPGIALPANMVEVEVGPGEFEDVTVDISYDVEGL